jgi:hypothetical protein
MSDNGLVVRDEIDKDLPYPWFRYFSEENEEVG